MLERSCIGLEACAELQMSLVSSQAVASLIERGADLTVEAIRQNCELLTKKDKVSLCWTSNAPACFSDGKDAVWCPSCRCSGCGADSVFSPQAVILSKPI